MAINSRAQKNHDELLPNYVSKLAISDPELIEVFDNFAFDEVLSYGSLGKQTRLMVQLSAIIASHAVLEYRVMLGGALNTGVTPNRSDGSPLPSGAVRRSGASEAALGGDGCEC